MSLCTSSFHPFLGLPLRLVPSSSWMKIYLGILSSSVPSRWPNQLILCSFIHFTIFPPLLISSIVLITIHVKTFQHFWYIYVFIRFARISYRRFIATRCKFIYVFIKFARISYRRFIVTRCTFNLSTYVHDLLVIGRRVCVQREVYTRKLLAADNGHKQSSEKAVR